MSDTSDSRRLVPFRSGVRALTTSLRNPWAEGVTSSLLAICLVPEGLRAERIVLSLCCLALNVPFALQALLAIAVVIFHLKLHFQAFGIILPYTTSPTWG